MNRTILSHIVACLLAMAGCSQERPSPSQTPTAIPTPGFDGHCRACKQCGGGLLDENGEEQGLCEEGFRLWQDDLRREWARSGTSHR